MAPILDADIGRIHILEAGGNSSQTELRETEYRLIYKFEDGKPSKVATNVYCK